MPSVRRAGVAGADEEPEGQVRRADLPLRLQDLAPEPFRFDVHLPESAGAYVTDP